MQPHAAPLKLLLVEDSEADALRVERILQSEKRIACELTRVDLLSSALKRLDAGGLDLVILDLSLPDSYGVSGVEALRGRFPDVPVVVLTGNDDEETALRALQAGAQDYLAKGSLDGEVLARSIRYALERHRLQFELEAAQRRGAGERELRAIGRLTDARHSLASAALLNQSSLSAAQPGRFSDFVGEFAEVMDVALEKRAYKVDSALSDRLRELAEQLSYLRAGPRDVIEVYRAAVASQLPGSNPAKLQAYLDEARLLALELMGNLVSCYRPYSIGVPGTASTLTKSQSSQQAGV